MWWLQSFNTWIVPATATTLKPINPSAFRITSGEASEIWKVLGRCQNQTSYLKPAHQSSFLKIRLRSCQYVKILMSLWLREYWSLWISKILLFTLPASHFHRIKCNTNTMHLCLVHTYCVPVHMLWTILPVSSNLLKFLLEKWEEKRQEKWHIACIYFEISKFLRSQSEYSCKVRLWFAGDGDVRGHVHAGAGGAHVWVVVLTHNRGEGEAGTSGAHILRTIRGRRQAHITSPERRSLLYQWM